MPKSKPRHVLKSVLAPSSEASIGQREHTMAKVILTDHQRRVDHLLSQIPRGRISTYSALAKAAKSSPRAIGGAMKNNPFAPEVPCHRCIASSGFLGGYKGDWRTEPSGQNCSEKLRLLKEEGVEFDEKGMLTNKAKLWDDFDISK